jgi:hypothetical protein
VRLGGHKVLFRKLQHRRPYPQTPSPWTLWNPPTKPRKARPRKTPHAVGEFANRDAYYPTYWPRLESYEQIATTGLEGWEEDEEADAAFLVASFFTSPAFKGKEYRLPDSVLRRRWRLGCKRNELIVPFAINGGLGPFDKYGLRLPEYCQRVIMPRVKTHGPYLCRYPLASIYLVGGRISGVAGEVGSFRRLRIIRETSKWLLISTARYRLSRLRSLTHWVG